MTTKRSTLLAVATAVSTLVAAGCEKDTNGLGPAPPITDPRVFIDGFGDALPQSFLGTKLDALQIGDEAGLDDSPAIEITLPGPGDLGTFAGGALVSSRERDLSGYDALTFWARANRDDATLDVAGLGNDNTGTSRFTASWSAIDVTTAWRKFIVPVPDPSKLTYEAGLFFYADSHDPLHALTLWFDDIQYERLGDVITNPRPRMSGQSVTRFVTGTAVVQGTETIFDVEDPFTGDTGAQTIAHSPGYFSFASSDEKVATVDADGVITVTGTGDAVISATFRDLAVTGQVAVTGTPIAEEAAPTPTLSSTDVISLYSNAYTNCFVDRWSTEWDFADYQDLKIAGDDTKAFLFSGQQWNGSAIEFTSEPIDAEGPGMTHFHLDIWVPGPAAVRVKLVDFGNNGESGGGDDSESELTLSAASNPPIVPGEWSVFEIPLGVFGALQNTAHLAQLIISIESDENYLFLDNVYFHK